MAVDQHPGNGIQTARLIQNMPGKMVLLTSDFHMFRAIHVFRKLGIVVTPMVAPDLLQTASHWNGRFSAFETLLIETVKIVDYEFRGWL